eukprot:CAMPEP_0168728972 /NCGR_PEP_ID=MMETSP0724-20121128/5957_1 /TAXON_ID=265536 /ORGANISM="Amphiprora sp., Strain CCMP467" /LENGTH=122 /DNA_ID=CAMNT_0008775829 /DNA_START=161 /DNA_END=530 /DNA_ORIENTATION=+
MGHHPVPPELLPLNAICHADLSLDDIIAKEQEWARNALERRGHAIAGSAYLQDLLNMDHHLDGSSDVPTSSSSSVSNHPPEESAKQQPPQSSSNLRRATVSKTSETDPHRRVSQLDEGGRSK